MGRFYPAMGRFYRPMGDFYTHAKNLIYKGFEVKFLIFFFEYNFLLTGTQLEDKRS
jgi:hypothetical protein